MCLSKHAISNPPHACLGLCIPCRPRHTTLAQAVDRSAGMCWEHCPSAILIARGTVCIWKHTHTCCCLYCVSFPYPLSPLPLSCREDKKRGSSSPCSARPIEYKSPVNPWSRFRLLLADPFSNLSHHFLDSCHTGLHDKFSFFRFEEWVYIERIIDHMLFCVNVLRVVLKGGSGACCGQSNR